MLAWLNTAPRPDKPPQRGDPAIPTRLEKMRMDRKDVGYLPELPEASAPHLLAYLWDAGPTLATSVGAGPLTHSELLAWQHNSGIDLPPWQAQMLRRLSIEYLNERSQAESPDCPAPVALTTRNDDRAHVGKKIQSAMQMLTATRPQRSGLKQSTG